MPSTVNNVETFCHVPHIVENGAEWFRGFGTEKSPGTTIFGVSGHVERPGLYELPLGTRLDEIVFEHAGGVPGGRKVKGVIPGGMSMPILPAGQLDVLADCPQCDDGCSVVCQGTECECDCPDPEPDTSAAAAPTDRPCSVDEECHGVADCECACTPRLRTAPLPEGEAWQTMCDGHPPPPCGVQSPCAELRASCREGVCVMEAAAE